MFVKQLTVFIENRVGTLEEVMQVLADKNINIYSISLADTSEYGLLRLIVEEPDKAKTFLKEAGFTAKTTELVAVKLENKVGTLLGLTEAIANAGVGVEYMYAMAVSKTGIMILKTSDGNAAVDALTAAGYTVLSQDALYNIE